MTADALRGARTCSVADCERTCKGRGLCNMHYQRWRKTGGTDATPVRQPAICSVSNCTERARGRGWCGTHWLRWRKHGDPTTVLVGTAATPGAGNKKWQGDNVGYGTAHERVRKARGPARDLRCVDCESNATSWSYDHLDPDERIDPRDPKRMPYSVKVEHFQPRCDSCHWRIDHPNGKVKRA